MDMDGWGVVRFGRERLSSEWCVENRRGPGGLITAGVERFGR